MPPVPAISPWFWTLLLSGAAFGALLLAGVLAWNHFLQRKVQTRTRELSETVERLHAEASQREIAQKALAASEYRYRTTLDSMPDATYVVDRDLRVTLVNDALQRLAFPEGLPPELTGTRLHDAFAFLGDYARDELQEVFSAGREIESEHTITIAGKDLVAEIHRIPVLDDRREVQFVVSVIHDVTAARRAQAALAESESRYRFLFEESPAGSVVIGTDGNIHDINKNFLRVLGYDRNDVVGRPALDFVAPDTRERVADSIRRRFSGESVDERDTPVVAHDGSVHTIVFSTTQTMVYEGDRVTGFVITGLDVTTARKAEELNRIRQQQLIQADKMASLGILVSGVAHEINNPNNFIALNSDNLRDIWKDVVPILDKRAQADGDFRIAGLPYSEVREEVGRLISGVSEGSQRIRTIVQSLKDFARQSTGDMSKPVNLNEVIAAAQVILANLIRKSTDRFVVTPAAELPAFSGDFQRIEQVAINLIANACQALTSRAQGVEVATRFDAQQDAAVLTVRDEGRGISPESMKHIMDPFYTTKRDTGGTGLGLSISYGIVKDHGGQLVIESKEGAGTTVTVALPVKRT